MSRVRIKDIAEIANVSIGTVDRVIHNRGEVSIATRERIRKILEEYKFKPDIIASSLALKRQVNLAVVMPAPVNDHAFWELPRRGVEHALEELSTYRISIDSFYFDQFNRDDFIRAIRHFPYSQLHGILFAPVFRDESLLFMQRCDKEGLPVVLFNSLIEEGPFRSYVGQDAFQSGYVAAKLINYGLEHRRDAAIINISSRKGNYTHLISRERGFRRYFEEHSDRLDHLVTVDLSGTDGAVFRERMDEIFTAYRLGGIFVTNSRVYKVAEYLAGRGSMSVRLVGYDLLPESVELMKRDYIDFLISQKPEEQAFRGLSSLFHLVAFNRIPEKKQLMPIDIITRENLSHYKL